VAQLECELQGDKGMNLKTPTLRDRAYLDWLRDQPCLLTGVRGESEPAHIGTAGKGIKSPDNEAIPLHYELHRKAHQHGEISMLRERAPDDVLRAAFRALARENYAAWKAGK
jgi:hypothetical protein